MQSISSQDYKGKRMKFSAFVKIEAADRCGVWARVDDATNDVLQFDNMMERAIIVQITRTITLLYWMSMKWQNHFTLACWSSVKARFGLINLRLKKSL